MGSRLRPSKPTTVQMEEADFEERTVHVGTPKGTDVNGLERGAIVLPSGREAIRRFVEGDRKKWIRHYDLESVEEHDLLNRQGAKKDRKRQN